MEPATGMATWRLRHFPTARGLDEQDAKLMDALAYLRQVANHWLRRRRDAGSGPDDELRQHHDQVRKERTVH